MVELWLDIGIVKGVDYTGYYQISNKGRVKSLERYVNFRGRKRLVKERILKSAILPHTHDINYNRIVVVLNKDGVGSTNTVAILVATAFIPNPENKPEVNHLNNDPTFNYDYNLEWATHKENMEHAMEFGKLNSIPKKEVVKVVELYLDGESATQISKIYGVSLQTVLRVLKRNEVEIRTPREERLNYLNK